MSGKQQQDPAQRAKMFRLLDEGVINQTQAAARFDLSRGTVCILMKARKNEKSED